MWQGKLLQLTSSGCLGSSYAAFLQWPLQDSCMLLLLLSPGSRSVHVFGEGPPGEQRRGSVTIRECTVTIAGLQCCDVAHVAGCATAH
jgi:hypothetical protein